jgi:hypothetical protein
VEIEGKKKPMQKRIVPYKQRTLALTDLFSEEALEGWRGQTCRKTTTLIESNCVLCNKAFLHNPKSRSQKYCSQECYFVRKKAKMVQRTCQHCNSTFQVHQSWIEAHNTGAKYCSKKCFTQR